MKKAAQPPYSPDIAPSDFYLFGYIKELLKGARFESPQQLYSAITEILSGISPETLTSVFMKWEDKLQGVSEANGNYLP